MVCNLKINRVFTNGTYSNANVTGTSSTHPTSGDRKYDVWGAVRGGNTTGYPNNRYCANLGHVADDELGLIYMRARYYEPGTGRFISEDPVLDGGNWYVYAGNDPIQSGDFTGGYKFEINGYTFRLDLDHGGDLHVWKDGVEQFAKWADGTNKKGHAPGEWTKDMIKTLVNAAKSGDPLARGLLKKMKEIGNFGLTDDMFRKGGVVGMAITSLDAYAQYDPEDFVGILSDIATGGR